MMYHVQAKNTNGDFINFTVEVPEGKTIEEVVYPKMPEGDWHYIFVKTGEPRGIGEISLSGGRA